MYLYSALSTESALYKYTYLYLTLKAIRHGSHSVTCNYTNACLYLVSVHQIALPQTEVRISNCSLLLIYIPQKDERLSRPGWLTYSGPT